MTSASVVVSASDFPSRRELAANGHGEFRVDNLPPGEYAEVVRAPGFDSARAEIVVVVGSVRDLHVVLKPQLVRQTVAVPAQASSITTQPLDFASAAEQGVVTQQDLQSLPLATRSFANIAYLFPGTEPVEPSDPTNYVGTLGWPIKKGTLWSFTSFEYVSEDASIAYSRTNVSQFDFLAQLASMELIPRVNSIPVPDSIGVPFRDSLIMQRFDWAQSQHSQWTLRAAVDRYTTYNDLVQQGTLPGTGATSRSNYMNLLLSQRYSFSLCWLGSFVFEASGLRRTETRNSDLGYALAFPFSTTALTTSGSETFGDKQFVTPIAAFPVLRNQQKYQFRYDVTHSMARHAPRFGVNFIHEPVLNGSLANPETIIQYPADPSVYVAAPAQLCFSATCAPPPPAGSGIVCTRGSGGFGPFSQNIQRLGLYARDSWRLTPQLTFN